MLPLAGSNQGQRALAVVSRLRRLFELPSTCANRLWTAIASMSQIRTADPSLPDPVTRFFQRARFLPHRRPSGASDRESPPRGVPHHGTPRLKRSSRTRTTFQGRNYFRAGVAAAARRRILIAPSPPRGRVLHNDERERGEERTEQQDSVSLASYRAHVMELAVPVVYRVRRVGRLGTQETAISNSRGRHHVHSPPDATCGASEAAGSLLGH